MAKHQKPTGKTTIHDEDGNVETIAGDVEEDDGSK